MDTLAIVLVTQLFAFQNRVDLIARPPNVEPTRYRVFIDSPGGELPFLMEYNTATMSSVVVNGTERIAMPRADLENNRILVAFNHYDSVLSFEIDDKPTKFAEIGREGKWIKRGRDGQTTEMKCSVEPFQGYRFRPTRDLSTGEKPLLQSVDGRWAVRFESEESPAVGVFEQKADGAVAGTFLTDTGDYRYLAGSYEHGLLRLSCFDGSHAFLFHATMQNDGTLKGDFWSGAKWHETWTAKRDAKAQLADGFSLAKWSGKADFGAMKFKNTEGAEASVQSLVEGGKGAIIEVFGSWCPNCSDAGRMLAELDSRYRDKGLRIVGLAFEYSGQFERDVKQLRRFAERHGTTYPLLLAGKADKNEAAKTLPMLDRVVAFPTFIFAKPDGTIAAVYTGFSGPATGEEHERLKQRFVREIESLLGNPKSKH